MRSLVPILAVFLTAAGCSRDPNVVKRKYLEAGNKYFQRQKYKEASIMYRTAIRKDPRFAEAYFRNAVAVLRLGKYTDAERNLRRAVELLPEGPDRMSARTQLADIYLAYISNVERDRLVMGEVRTLADEILLQDANSFDGHRIRGTLASFTAVHLSGKFPDDASDELRKAIVDLRAADAIRPFHPEVVVALARALWADNQPDQAERYLKRLVIAQPGLTTAYSELHRFYAKNGRWKEAEDILTKGSEKNPKHYDFLVSLANMYQEQGRRADMIAALNRLKAQSSNSAMAFEVAGNHYLRFGEPAEAIREYEAGIRIHSADAVKFQKLIVNALLAQNKRAEAGEVTKLVLKKYPKDTDALAIQAQLLLEGGQIEQSISMFQALIQRDPVHVQSRYNLGRALLTAGRPEEARVEFREAIRQAPDYIPARMALGRIQIETGEYGNAVITADEILTNSPKNGDARLLRAIGLRLIGKLAEARTELNNLVSLNPKSDQALFQLGVLNATQNNWREAESAFRRSYEANPANVTGLLQISEYYWNRKEVERAIETVRREAKRRPDRPELRLSYAGFASRAGRWDEAAAEFKALLKMLENNPRATGNIYLRLGELTYRSGNVKESLDYYEKANALLPNDAIALESLGITYDVLGRKKEAAAMYQASLKLKGNAPTVLNNLAFYIAHNGGDLDQALTYAQRARQIAPEQLELSDTIAYIYLKKNLIENALEILEELVRKKPADPAFRIHLGEALLKKGETTKAKKELHVALASKPSAEDAAKIKDLLAKTVN